MYLNTYPSNTAPAKWPPPTIKIAHFWLDGRDSTARKTSAEEFKRL